MSGSISGLIVGFTGSRAGMTEAQKTSVETLLNTLSVYAVIHGDCVGADAQFHVLAQKAGLRIAIYPGCELGDRRRAGCEGAEFTIQVRPFIKRNHKIVTDSNLLIAAPNGDYEELRSGTWATIRYAHKTSVPVKIVWPDGRVGGYKNEDVYTDT